MGRRVDSNAYALGLSVGNDAGPVLEFAESWADCAAAVRGSDDIAKPAARRHAPLNILAKTLLDGEQGLRLPLGC